MKSLHWLILSVAVVLYLSVLVRGQSCTSTYLKTFTNADSASSKASSYVCPIGFVNAIMGSANRTCVPVTDALNNFIGKSCESSTYCGFNFLGCATSTNKCDYKKTRILGDSCTVRENCLGSFGTISGGTNCLNGTCVSMSVSATVSTAGEKCNGANVDTEKNVMYTCANGFTCYLEQCVKLNYNAVGGPCNTGTVNYVRDTCATGLVCDGTTCAKPTILKEGENCTASSILNICDTGLVCRKKGPGVASSTCEKPSVYREYCESASDCYSLPVLVMKCSKNKCQRKYYLSDGSDCEKSDDCYSSYCEMSTLKCKTPLLTCTTTSLCPTGTGYVCGCGGSSSATGFNGTCIASCQGYLFDYQACAYNNGVDELAGLPATAGSYVIDKSSSILNNTCAKEYLNLLRCHRKSSANAGVYTGAATIPDFDISGDPVPPTSIIEPVVGRNISAPGGTVKPKTSVSAAERLTNNSVFIYVVVMFIATFVSLMY